MKKRFKGIVFAVSLFITSFLGSIFFLFPFLFLIVLSPQLYRKIVDNIVYYWFLFVVALVESFLGIEVIVDFAPNVKLDPKARYLIIMNHYSRVDWLFFWSCLYRIEFLLTHKIILKAPLKRIPGAGWAMQMANFIFINRKWEMDQVILSSSIDYFTDLNYAYKILLFPEGTDFSPSNIRKSREYAIKNNLPVYKHLLQPRTTGFVYLVEKMRQGGHLDTILDVTVSYYNRSHYPGTASDRDSSPNGHATPYHHRAGSNTRNGQFGADQHGEGIDPFASPCTETGILRGDYPDIVRFSCRTYDAVADLPAGPEALAAWCRSLWSDKDAALDADQASNNDIGKSETKVTAPTTPTALVLGAWYSFIGLVVLAGTWPGPARLPITGFIALACCTFGLLHYCSSVGDVSDGGGLDRIAVKLRLADYGPAKKSSSCNISEPPNRL